MGNQMQLTIDGHEVAVETGSTILDAVRAAGIYIPTLCADDDLEPYGACRLCLVEVEGQRRPILPSCTTPASEGMVVRTSSPLIDKLRRNIVALMLSDHPSDCLSCPQNNRCELQQVAAYLGLRDLPFAGEKHSLPLDDSNPFYVRDLERCILCGRCVRTCDEIQNRRAIHYAYRGFATKIATELDRDVRESTCEFCGQCVSKCPVGALYTVAEWDHGLPTGSTKTICTYCGVGCGLILQTRGNLIVGALGDAENPASEGRTCVKGRFGYDFVNHPDRLTTPLIRESGKLVEATWDQALDYVADRLAEIKRQHGGDAIGVLSSAKCTNEENYLLQKFTRAVLGTNNVDHCARL
jgi:predicted molibdopterin-dependent oxidoreductase YjgC